MNVDIECVCPPTSTGDVRHPKGDRVELRETLDFRSARSARTAIIFAKQEDPDIGVAELQTILTESYILFGIESWTIVDAKGKRVEVSRAAIRSFMEEHWEAADTVCDAATNLYNEKVVDPLVRRASALSQPTPTDASTSATPGPTPRQKPSRRSSTSTIRMDGIETTSSLHAGASSS
jgi:hypothetical protein